MSWVSRIEISPLQVKVFSKLKTEADADKADEDFTTRFSRKPIVTPSSRIDCEIASTKERPVILCYRGTCKRNHQNREDRPMPRILPEIYTLEQHQELILNDQDAYRPECCPHCGKAGLHHHGHYERNPPKGEGLAFLLGMLIILRFFCPNCRRTCSRLPGCLSPRRHYWWKSQQGVLKLLLSGGSFHAVASKTQPSRQTIGRWWRRLNECFECYTLHLRSRFPSLGRTTGGKDFWSHCFDVMSLAEAMGWLDHEGVNVP